jgi:hypothetical protein
MHLDCSLAAEKVKMMEPQSAITSESYCDSLLDGLAQQSPHRHGLVAAFV